MKICVPSTGQGLAARVDRSFGQAAFFAVVDVPTMRCRCLRNLPLLPGQSGEKLTAEMVSLLGVDGVLVEEIGDGACQILQSSGIRIFAGVLRHDTVAAAVANFQRGAYEESNGTGPPPLR